MMCSFGVAPSTLVVLPLKRVITKTPSANSTDFIPVANIPPFGACSSLANPTVAAATSAALGVLTPMPCVPVTAAPWVPGSTKVMNGGMPAVDSNCKLMCTWGGVIQVLNPGQTVVIVG
jgi:hypothetical protein